VTLVFGGDVCATGVNEAAFAAGDAATLFGALAPRLREADFVAVNLESPLYEQPRGIRKSGPVLGVPANCVAGLAAGGVDLVGLANNHAMDHSAAGLESTVQACARQGIATVGAGANLAAARRMHVAQLPGVRLGVLAFAEREFGLAGRDKPGVNPLDAVEFVRAVRHYKGSYDYLAVMLHGGNEHLRIPRPSLVELCRFFVEEGANLVLCQHSHCLGCIEQYRGGTIVYGQGNFIFESGADEPDSWREGALVFVGLEPGLAPRVELVPVAQVAGVPGARALEGEARQSALDALARRSTVLADPAALERHWEEFCAGLKPGYLRRLGARSRLGRGVDRLTKNIQAGYAASWKTRAEHLNLIRCESHREALIRILSEGFE
jgi:poly-gamma-glutamate synthesis protein (capsule biosynthesis protein)